jgi:hypothetical protein
MPRTSTRGRTKHLACSRLAPALATPAACSAADGDQSSRWVDQAHYSNQSTATATATAMLHRQGPVEQGREAAQRLAETNNANANENQDTHLHPSSGACQCPRAGAAPRRTFARQSKRALLPTPAPGTPLQAGRPLFTANRAHSPLMWHGSALDSILRYSAANMVECGEITWRWAGVVGRPLRLAQRLGLGAGLRLTRARL